MSRVQSNNEVPDLTKVTIKLTSTTPENSVQTSVILFIVEKSKQALHI